MHVYTYINIDVYIINILFTASDLLVIVFFFVFLGFVLNFVLNIN